MGSVKKSLKYSVLTQFVSKIIDFLSVIIFARMLTPSELGVLAIASSIAFIASEFKLLGTNNYIVREKVITTEIIRSCVGLAILISWLLGFITLVISVPASIFYENEDLKVLLCILSVSFFFSPFTSTTAALLTREMRFDSLIYLQLIGKVLGLAVSIYLVSEGYSYFGVVTGMTTSVLVDFLLARLIKPKDMSWRPRFAAIGNIVGFGIINSLINLLKRMETTAPDIVIGKVGTPRDVALISRGVGLHMFLSEFLLNGIRSVVMPYLSRTNRDGGDINYSYIKATNLLLAFALPPILVAGIAAEPLVLLLFGDQWVEAVPIAQSMTIWMGIKLLSNLAFPTLIVMKAEKSLLAIQIFLITVLITFLILLYPFGLEMIHWPFIICATLEFCLIGILLKKYIKLSFLLFFTSIYKALVIAMVCCFVALTLKENMSTELSDITKVFGYALALIPTWLFTLMITKHPLMDEIISVVRRLQGDFRRK